MPWRRIGVVAAVMLGGAALSWTAHPPGGAPSDFTYLRVAAGMWVSGSDPYTTVGPGRAYDVPHGVFYPFTAVLFAVPFTFTRWPDQLFVAVSTGLLAWGLTSGPRYRPVWFAFLTPAYIYAARMSQWSALIAGAALVPWCGLLLACKPTTGAALWLAFPSRRAAIGGALFVAISLALLPSWPASWLAETRVGTAHIRAPITYWGGPLLLLSLLRWRRSEGRLLAAMSCIPHTPELYESLALFFIPGTMRQGALLAVLGYGVVLARGFAGPAPDYISDMTLTGQWMVWLLYLPCLAMVLSRPNQPNTGEPPPTDSESPAGSNG